MSNQRDELAFRIENYYIMLGGVALLFLGLILMSLDTQTFGFGPLGLTVGPIMVFLGFISQFFAIFYKSRKKIEEK